jgi:hypothetical protein
MTPTSKPAPTPLHTPRAVARLTGVSEKAIRAAILAGVLIPDVVVHGPEGKPMTFGLSLETTNAWIGRQPGSVQ